MKSRSSTWSMVLAFDDPQPDGVPGVVDAAGGIETAAWHEAVCLDTLDAVLAAVEPSCLRVLTAIPALAEVARDAGAGVVSPRRGLNADLSDALTHFVREAPERSGIVVLGPLPQADAETVAALLRACAATEAAVVASDDEGTVALSHHDPSRIEPRFGGASAGRHARTHVRVGRHLDGLSRTAPLDTSRLGAHARAVLTAQETR